MGITYHPSIGVEKLKEKINAKLNPTDEEDLDQPVKTTVTPERSTRKAQKKPKKVLMQEYHQRLRKEANRLMRIVVSCRNPNKKNFPGEIFTVGNAIVGTIKKYVPFDNENGYHIPYMIYKQLKTKRCQIWVDKKTPGRPTRKVKKFIPEYNIIDLEALTSKEMYELKEQQALNHSIDRD